jgi:CRISPR-associated protein Csb2
MFALRFRFPAGRYHATPWGRNVNEADVAWPPEPWRLLRTLIAAYWRKGDHERWSEGDLGNLIDALAETCPVYRLPEGGIHAHTRHYMPQARGNPKLIFDAFVRLPEKEAVVAAWLDVTLDTKLFALAADLAVSVGYLGRAESWTECEALADWRGEPNCGPREAGFSGDPVQLLAPRSPSAYQAERGRLIAQERRRISSAAKNPQSTKRLEAKIAKEFRSKKGGVDTLPERLVDALALDTADCQDRGWPRPPASREVLYARDEKAAVAVVPRVAKRRGRSPTDSDPPTVARFLLAGRPRPRVEDTVKIGELMRLAALAQFGWRRDDESGRRVPKAPWQVSGRGTAGEPLRDPYHRHAYWLPEDADSDGSIDHISVFIAAGIDRDIRARLDRITRLWLEPKQRIEDDETGVASATEWQLALEGFGKTADFAGSAPIFGASTRWRSTTPFLAAGRLKVTGYAGEFRRLVKRTGMDRRFGFDAIEVDVSERQEAPIGGTTRRTLHFHRFRSRGREAQHDTAGIFLDVVFPVPVDGPLAFGYGSHFGLGLFVRS